MIKLIVGKNDLATTHPEYAKEWDYEKNGDLKPTDLSYGSDKKVWWKCAKGHSFSSSPASRIGNNIICPYCSNKKVLQGYNDLETTNPELLIDWDYEKNSVKPSEVVVGSGKTIWWKCHICGNEWPAKLADRKRGVGCAVCKNKKVKAGYNDLATTNPELLIDWDYEKNSVKPSEIVAGSKKRIWWKCHVCGHLWPAVADNRRRGQGCPNCYKRNQTSFSEQAVFYYVSQKYNDAVNGYTDIFAGTMELDIFIPSLRTGIEYDGAAWHNSQQSQKRESDKYQICKEKGIRLIRIKESENKSDSESCDVLLYSKDTLNDTIRQLSPYLELPKVDVENDRQKIQENYYTVLKEKSILSINPELAKEWDYEKNGDLTPDMFTPNSGEKVWWKCTKGHSYSSTPSHRAEGKGCPYCSGQKVLVGFNDLATTNPELAKEWDYEKNGDLKPTDITEKSGIRVWWKCEKGHTWPQKPLKRQKSNCPYCGGKKVLVGFNDFQTLQPEISKEFCYEKNGDLKPSQFTCGSNVKVWWKCKDCGHEWKASFYSRNKGTGCYHCSKKRGATKRSIKVKCVELDEVFDSIKEANERFNLGRGIINNCLRGTQKTAGGYHWKIEEE